MGRKKKYNSHKEASAAWKRDNKEHVRKYSREYDQKRRDEDPEYRARRNEQGRKSCEKRAATIKDTYRLKKYGVSPERYAELHEECSGVCLICEKVDKTDLSIDHHHETGEVRGLLCRSCNLMVGNLEKHVDVLEKMLIYCGIGVSRA